MFHDVGHEKEMLWRKRDIHCATPPLMSIISQ